MSTPGPSKQCSLYEKKVEAVEGWVSQAGRALGNVQDPWDTCGEYRGIVELPINCSIAATLRHMRVSIIMGLLSGLPVRRHCWRKLP